MVIDGTRKTTSLIEAESCLHKINMMSKLKNALVLVVLTASTYTSLSWWDNDETTINWESSDLLSRRQLTHESMQTNNSTLYDRERQRLVAKGHKPGTDKSERMVRTRVRRKERKLKVMQQTKEQREVMKILKDKKDLWLRGKGISRRADERSCIVLTKLDNNTHYVLLLDLAQEKHMLVKLAEDYEPLNICDRPTEVSSTEDFSSLQQYAECPEITQDKPMLLISGVQSHGRTGNNLVEFLHAIQQARDTDSQLGIMAGSWPIHLLTKMWMAIEGDEDAWTSQFENAFCVKIFQTQAQLEGWDVTSLNTKDLLHYGMYVKAPLGEYMASQEYAIRTLFRNYNTGVGYNRRHKPVKDMCSGIDALFGEKQRTAVYSVVHSRTLEGAPGLRLLRTVARKSGCDPVAALEMEPDYVKSILKPLGMMKHPIVVISDGQNPTVVERLLADPEIGPMIRVVPEEACWLGGDLTLATMSNVFIGNPASSASAFIAKSRLALGFGHNYLFRAKDKKGQFRTVCGDHCVFDRTIMGPIA
ncbi:hypothetical protein ACHAXR_003440 [Thalassiosira sp. AJA248-18]